MEEHFILCEYEDVTCAACDEEMQRRLLQTHTASECRNRIVQCEYCDKAYQFWLTETHKGGECTRFPLDCPQECGVLEIPREEVESHVKDDCTMTMVVCLTRELDVPSMIKGRDLKAHLEVSSE
ncbi:TNF receptor-associated factor 4, partial [Desmophyllum pertusum]